MIALLIGLGLSPNANAHTSDPVEATLYGDVALFDKIAADSGEFPAGSPLTIRFFTLSDATLEMEQVVSSQVNWLETMVQSWAPVAGGGWMLLDADVTFEAEIGFDLFGYTDTWSISSTHVEWVTEALFDSILLPGVGSGSATVGASGNDTFEIDQAYDGGLWSVGVNASVHPEIETIVTGDTVTTNEVLQHRADEDTVLQMPTESAQTYDIDTAYIADVSSDLSLELVTTLYFCIAIGDCYDIIELPLPWTIASNTVTLTTEPVVIEHPVPAMVSDVTVIDMGTTVVGEPISVELPLYNFGLSALEGEVEVGANGISTAQQVFYADPQHTSTIVIEFDAAKEGTTTGMITLYSNDPAQPTVEVPVAATAIAEGEVVTDSSGEFVETIPPIGFCGCSSTESGRGLYLLSLPMLLILLRRRNEVGQTHS